MLAGLNISGRLVSRKNHNRDKAIWLIHVMIEVPWQCTNSNNNNQRRDDIKPRDILGLFQHDITYYIRRYNENNSMYGILHALDSQKALYTTPS